MYTLLFSYSSYVVRLPVWCITIGRWSQSSLSQVSWSFTLNFVSTGFVLSNCLLQEQVLFILYFKTWAICIVEDRDSEICEEK